MYPRKFLIILLALGIGYFLFRVISNSPTKEVLQFLDHIAEQSSFESNAHPLEKLAWAKRISEFCIEPCKITIVFEDELREFRLSHEDSVRYLGALRVEVEQLAVTISDQKVSAEKERAKVKATLRGMGRSPGREDYFLEQHEVEIKLVKDDGKWKIESAMNMKPIVRSANKSASAAE